MVLLVLINNNENWEGTEGRGVGLVFSSYLMLQPEDTSYEERI